MYRPIAVQIVTIALLLLTIYSTVLSVSGIESGNWIFYYSLINKIILFASIYGLWFMKKWGLFLYLGLAMLTQIVMAVVGIWSFPLIIAPTIVIGTFLFYYSKLS